MKSITKTNIFFMCLAIFYLIVFISIRFIPPQFFSVNFSLVLGEIIILIPSVVYLIITRFKPLKEMRFKPIKISNILIIILLTYLCMPVLSLLNYISMFFTENAMTDVFSLLGGNPLWLNLFFIAFLPAFCEELAFRGILYHSYRKRSMFAGMLMSAFLFGLFHMNLNQFFYAAFMGIMFVLVVEATGSIFASMIIHFVVNANSVVVSYFYTNVLKLSENELAQSASIMAEFQTLQIVLVTAVLVAAAVIGLVLAILVYIWLCKRNGSLERIKQMVRKPGRKIYSSEHGKIIGIPLVIGILICIGFVIYNDLIL